MSTMWTEDETVRREAGRRWDSLTKPPGSLGRLEEMVLRYAVIRGSAMPLMRRKGMYIFCAGHGVAAEGVSAFPPEVTAQMVRNFLRGGAAITVLCRRFGIEPMVVDVGVPGPVEMGAIDCKVAEGTANFARGPAMTPVQLEQAMEAGRSMARHAAERFDVAGVGEMGIGNTTSAAALLCAFTGIDAAEAAGRGTGLDGRGVEHKAEVIRRALALHRPRPEDAAGTLAALGGFEIAAMAGMILEAARLRLPVVLDGFICCAAALAARAIQPDGPRTVFYSHRSAEQAHAKMLESLGAEPFFTLDMRLGEGSGAALAINLLETALTLYREMASFEEAGVSGER